MPEGHSIHRIARQISDVFTGECVQVSSPQGRYAEGAALLDGHTITGAYAHGKHLFVTFENDLTLNVHLGIYGNWSFGGDETFTGASSIGAPRKIGEKNTRRGRGSLTPVLPNRRVRCVAVLFRSTAGRTWWALLSAVPSPRRRCAPSAPSSAPTRSTRTPTPNSSTARHARAPARLV